MEMLKSKGVTHIVNLAGGDLSLGAPHIDTAVYEGKEPMTFFIYLFSIFIGEIAIKEKYTVHTFYF